MTKRRHHDTNNSKRPLFRSSGLYLLFVVALAAACLTQALFSISTVVGPLDNQQQALAVLCHRHHHNKEDHPQRAEALRLLCNEDHAAASPMAHSNSNTTTTTGNDTDNQNASWSSVLQTTLEAAWHNMELAALAPPPLLNNSSDDDDENDDEDNLLPTIPHKVFVNWWQSVAEPQQDDVVLLTHTSVKSERLDHLWIQLQRWNGSVAVALYLQSLEDIHALVHVVGPRLQQELQHMIASTDDNNDNFYQVHLFLERKPSSLAAVQVRRASQDAAARRRRSARLARLAKQQRPRFLPSAHRDLYERGYPHNALRNLLLNQAPCDYVLALDADFVTSPQAHHGLQSLIRSNAAVRQRLHNQTVLVLPALERGKPAKKAKAAATSDAPPKSRLLAQVVRQHQADQAAASPANHTQEQRLPETKAQVVQWYQAGNLTMFHSSWPPGHQATNYTQWMILNNSSNVSSSSSSVSSNDTDDDDAAFYPIDFEYFFEPYVLGYRHALPRYWNGFRGFGFNKLSWFVELHRLGFGFGTLRDFYVLHLDHGSTRSSLQSKLNQEIHADFTTYVETRYGPDPTAKNDTNASSSSAVTHQRVRPHNNIIRAQRMHRQALLARLEEGAAHLENVDKADRARYLERQVLLLQAKEEEQARLLRRSKRAREQERQALLAEFQERQQRQQAHPGNN